MDRNLVAVYKMFVYEDGQVELISQPLYVFENQEMPARITTINVSERIRQIMNVIDYVFHEIKYGDLWSSLNETLVGKQVSSAYKKIAGKNSIAEQTVADKCGRQLGLTKSEFVRLMFDYLTATYMYNRDYSKTDLYRVITQNVSNAADDLRYINMCFEQWKDQKREEL